MKIGIEVQHMFRPKKNGTDIITDELLKQFQETPSGHEFFLYTQSEKKVTWYPARNHMHLDVSCPASVNVWQQEHLPQAILKNDIDLLHCTSNTAPVGIKVPLIITISDIGCLEKSRTRYGSWYQRFENLYTQWNIPRIAKMADLIITVSNYEREQIIERLKLPEARVKTIYHAYAPHFTPGKNEEEMKAYRYRWQLPERFVLFSGNGFPVNNIGNVLQALNILYQNNQLDFTMVVPGINSETLHRLLHNYHCEHLQPFLFHTGYVPNHELPNLYRLAELFLYPCLGECFGMPVLEAMACGTPVITSNIGSIPELAGNEAFMVNAADPGDIAATITRVLKDEDLKKQAVAGGLKRAARYSWQKTTAEIMQVYETFIA